MTTEGLREGRLSALPRSHERDSRVFTQPTPKKSPDLTMDHGCIIEIEF
jgi:hypothetical protein